MRDSAHNIHLEDRLRESNMLFSHYFLRVDLHIIRHTDYIFCHEMCTLDISKIFCLLLYFTMVHKSMHIPLVSSKVTQKMD